MEPIASAADLERAVLAVARSEDWWQQARERGWIQGAAESLAAVRLDPIAEGLSVPRHVLERFAVDAHGLPCDFNTVVAGSAPPPSTRLFDNTARVEALRILYGAWKEMNAASAATRAADIFNADLIRFSMPLDDTKFEVGASWYQLMDEGILFFDDTPSQPAIRFLHPSDVGSCLLFFGKDIAMEPDDNTPLSDAE
jgi:hypothetical protein